LTLTFHWTAAAFHEQHLPAASVQRLTAGACRQLDSPVRHWPRNVQKAENFWFISNARENWGKLAQSGKNFFEAAIMSPLPINRLDKNPLGLVPLVESINLKGGTCAAPKKFLPDCANLPRVKLLQFTREFLPGLQTGYAWEREILFHIKCYLCTYISTQFWVFARVTDRLRLRKPLTLQQKTKDSG
jgi:hypothetical protein